MKRLTWFLAVLLLCGTGCEEYVLSLNPLCPDEACVVVPGLEGKWASGDQVWTFRPQDKAVYEVRVSDTLSAARFEGRARHLGETLFLDLRPVKAPEQVPTPSLFAAHWIQANSFMQVKLKGDALSLLRMNADGLTQKLLESPELVKHIIQDGSLILLDETANLARFVQAQAGASELWKEHGEFVRCAPLYNTEDLVQPEGLVGAWHDPNEKNEGRFDIRAQDKHYSIEVAFGSDERLTFAAHVFKLQGFLFMGVYLGPEDMRSLEMATRMPDWFALIALEGGRLNLTMLDFVKVKDLLAHPEKAEEIRSQADAQLSRVKGP